MKLIHRLVAIQIDKVSFFFFLFKIKRRRKIMTNFVIFRHPMFLMVFSVARRNYSVLETHM